MSSRFASSGNGEAPSGRVMILDVKRAFLYADITEEFYVELLYETKREGEGGAIVFLVKAMYGTREASLC